MAASDSNSCFSIWLEGVLDSLNMEKEVYVGYITGTLEALDGCPAVEMESSIAEVLSSCVVSFDSYMFINVLWYIRMWRVCLCVW